jgi:hypothetical protein
MSSIVRIVLVVGYFLGVAMALGMSVYTVLVLAALCGALFLLLNIYIRVGHHLETWGAIRLMRERGRLLSKADFEQKLADSSGSVIFEYPEAGWRVLRVWWTPDDVLAIAREAGISDKSPDPETIPVSRFDTWGQHQYTDLETGRALLAVLSLWCVLPNFSPTLEAHFPGMRTVFLYSGLVALWERHLFRKTPFPMQLLLGDSYPMDTIPALARRPTTLLRWVGYSLLVTGFLWLSVSAILLPIHIVASTSRFVSEGYPQKVSYSPDEIQDAAFHLSRDIRAGLPWIFTPALLMLFGGVLTLRNEAAHPEGKSPA